MRSLVLAVLLLTMPALASAQVATEETRFSVYGAVGFEPPLSGNIASAVTGTLSGTPLALGNVTMSDVYGALARWQFGVGIMLSERSELLGSFSYSAGGGSRARIGVTPGPLYVGAFDDSGEKSFEVGYRYHFMPFGRIEPYVTAAGGIVRSNAIDATLTIPNTSDPAINLPVLDGSSAGVIAGGGGIVIPLTPRLGILADVTLRWRGALNSANILVGTGLDDIGQDSARWSFPAIFGLTIRLGDSVY